MNETAQEKRSIEAYPLSWPHGQDRTDRPEHSRFDTGFGKARNFLFDELRRMGGSGIIVSTNIPLTRDGMPRANYTPDDPGVAVYFERDGKKFVFACDRYIRVSDNIQAIAKTIEALRGIERWGASDMMERAFTGFMALPEKASEAWREVLEFRPSDLVNVDILETRFKSLMRVYHEHGSTPDRDKFERIVEARNQARREMGL